MPTARVLWNRGLQFVGLSGSGHAVVADADEEVGGLSSGPWPTELVLIGLGACTSMDVVSILKKKRVEFDDFEVAVEAETVQDPPKHLAKIKLIYRVWGEGVTEEPVRQAIELSLEKYCTVANTLKGRAEISYECEINPA